MSTFTFSHSKRLLKEPEDDILLDFKISLI